MHKLANKLNRKKIQKCSQHKHVHSYSTPFILLSLETKTSKKTISLTHSAYWIAA